MGNIKLTKGLTILEIIISFVLISISVVGIYHAFAWIGSANVISRCEIQAAEFGRELMEELLMKEHSLLTAGLPSDLPNSDLKNKFFGSRSYELENIPEGKKITVIVAWKEAGRNRAEKIYGLSNPDTY